MEKQRINRQIYTLLSVLVFLAADANAQLTVIGQLRTRTEYRNGVGTLRPKAYDPAFFTTQRTRATLQYRTSRVVLQTSLQDVRVWGQDASTVSNADGARLGVHEAWAELVLSSRKDSTFKKPMADYLGVRIGRQEIMYDDSRLLGNLDWLQQARRHDAIVFKFLNKGWQADAGFAFNQNTDAFNYNGTYYLPANVQGTVTDSKGFLVATPSGMLPLVSGGLSSKQGTPALLNPPSTNGLNQHYKALQYLYVAKTFHATRIAALVLSDQFGRSVLDSVMTSNVVSPGFVYGRRFNQKGVNARVTTGVYVTSQPGLSKKWNITAGAYYQGGKDKDGKRVSAYTSTLSISHVRNKLTYTAGWDYLSGNDAFSASTTNHRFDPLYGTPHKHWGYMDYFYVATGSPVGGLNNPFAKVKYISANKRLSLGADYHYFSLAKDMKNKQGAAIPRYLGSEVDIVAGYGLNKFTTLELGVSVMAASSSMEYAKNIAPGTSRLTGTWSYLMINIRPEFLFK